MNNMSKEGRKIMPETFTPQLVQLTEKGKESVSHSANFREAVENNHVYMLEPVNEFGNILVGTDEKGTVVCLLPEASVVVPK